MTTTAARRVAAALLLAAAPLSTAAPAAAMTPASTLEETTLALAPALTGRVMTIPQTKATIYEVDGKALEAGEHEMSGAFTVTARAKPGHLLLGPTSSWDFTVQDESAQWFAAPQPPSFGPGLLITIPAIMGAGYQINGQDAAAGLHKVPAEGTYTVTAREVDGYTFVEGSLTSWSSALYKDAPAAGAQKMTPAAPRLAEGHSSVDIPAMEGAVYLIDGREVSEGTHLLRGRGVITATPLAGWTLAPGSASSWAYDATEEPLAVQVKEPAADDPTPKAEEPAADPTPTGQTKEPAADPTPTDEPGDATPTAEPDAAATPEASPAPGSAAGAPTSGQHEERPGALASTGAQVGVLAGAAAALIAVGAVLARRARAKGSADA